MKLKRMLAAFLTAALLAVLPAFPTASAASSGGFVDVTDPTVAQATETLRLLGIVSGGGNGYFYPAGNLTRAEFCKMAIETMGLGAKAEAQMNRTIFKDVLGSHWARGYVNLAASLPVGGEESGGGMLMVGVGDGTFHPDDRITYAEAVTILLRVLGYSTKELATGGLWYDGALATAKSIGLTEDFTLPVNSQITRGQTAILFEQMLFTPKKDGKDPYLVTELGGEILKEAVILSLDATTDDGVTGAVLTTGGEVPYKTDHAPFAPTLEGRRAKLVLDRNGKIIAIQPSAAGTTRTVSVVSTEVTYFTVSGGERVSVAPATTVYKDGKSLTYKDVYLNIKASTQAVLCYSAAGKLEYVFFTAADVAETAAIAKATGGNPFSSLVGSDTDYRVVKNGLPATLSDVRQYDVGTYDKATKTLYVSDLRLTGVYGNASPSPATPLTVTVLGSEFPVLSSAADTLAGFQIGSTITLLLTADGQVAGAVAPTEAKSTTVGIVEKIDGTSATVASLDMLGGDGKPRTFYGDTGLNAAMSAKLQGQLVTVSSSKVGQLNLTRLSASGASGSLDVNARALGGSGLSENIRLYERVGAGAPAEISFAQLTRATVPASKITYVGKDYAGRVNIIVFDDVTGDQYKYGMAVLGTASSSSSGSSPDDAINTTISVQSGDEASEALISGTNFKADQLIGIAASLERVRDTPRLAAWVDLKSVTKVSRSAFDMDDDAGSGIAPIGTVTTSSMTLPIAGNVVCYNKTTKTWFATLNEARAYSNSLTIYYDRTPQEGGKVRLVVVE
ncbi:MAG TPA: S-layer homology domain-containing protein [Pseudoflavonifractor sp.]|nr:S-layer homology domain-containing protein [Pseudoflavonifractor sp.]